MGFLAKTFSAELSKLHFTSTEKRFEDCFLEKRIFFSSFSNVIYKNLSNFWRQYFRKLVKVEVCVSRGISCRNIIFEKKNVFIIIVFWAKTFRTFDKKCSTDLSKMQSECPGEQFEEKNIFSEKICSFCTFLDFQPNCFNTLTEIFQYACRICILRVQRSSLRKKTLKRYILIQFPNSSKRFAISGKKISRVVVSDV